MQLYDYQKEVAKTLRAGKSVILQAPTGAGKTFAALWPFLESWDCASPTLFPSQCIYSAPMRVLTGQFERETKKIVGRMRLADLPEIHVQTGEFPDDPKFMSDLIFTTVDQTLSSALGVPYSLSHGQSNLNVGAVFGSYLVFDEFHLFPHQATATTLQLLRTIGKIAPFVLMTATFTQIMLQEIESLLGAKLICPSDEEILQIETRHGECLRKERQYQVVEHVIKAEDVYESHQQRSLAVCNTVDRAINLYNDLVKLGCSPVPFDTLVSDDIYETLRKARRPEDRQAILQKIVSIFQNHLTSQKDAPWVMLLHARFERPHRQTKEELLQALWSKEGINTTLHISLIVVATQVVEVGLDISAQTLHTELAPAANIFQRAGRCARFPGEQGTINIYLVPSDKNGNPNYMPYGSTALEKDVCKLTWDALRDRQNNILHFKQEQDVINIAHSTVDRYILDGMKQDEGRIWMSIADAINQGNNSSRHELIRESIESRTLLVYEPPNGLSEESPYRWDGFSLHHGTLRGRLNELKKLRDELGLEWALRYPYAQKDDNDDSTPVAYRWVEVNLDDEKEAKKEIGVSMLFAIHPRLVAYDAESGFVLAQRSNGEYRSKLAVRYREHPDYGGYSLESYLQHITRMRQVFDHEHLRSRLAWVSHRLKEEQGEWKLPAGLLERATLLAFALHDIGKLDARWQKWAREYQELINEDPPDFLIAHTHWDESIPMHKDAQKRTKAKKPKTHAGEGADAGARILWEALHGKENPGLYKAAFTAIARHHSPFLDGANPYHLHVDAEATLNEVLVTIGGPTWQDWAKFLRDSPSEEPDIRKRLIEPYPDSPLVWWWLYFLIVRNLRLCDGMSQEK